MIKVDGWQFRFCPGRSTTDAVFIVSQLQETFSEKKKKLYHVFVEVKAFHQVPRKAIEWALRRQKVPKGCSHVSVCIIEIKGETSSSNIRGSCHKSGSILSRDQLLAHYSLSQ